MKIKEHWKSRLGVIIGITGIWLTVNVTGGLIKHYKSATSYREKFDPLVDRQFGMNSTQQDNYDRMILMRIFSEKLTQEEYREHNDLINRVLNTPLTQEIGMDRLEYRMDIQMLRHKMEPSFLLRHPGIYAFLGMVLLLFGLYYAEKHKPATKPKPDPSEPTNPWDSLPAPALKKNPAVNEGN